MSSTASIGRQGGGIAARRAVVRWGWRLFRREWRQQLLIVSLLTFAVAGSIGFASAAYNIAGARLDGEFGTANHFFEFNNPQPAALALKFDAATKWFGKIDPVGHRALQVPGTTKKIDYRVQDPDGPFGGPLLDLRSGRYPTTVAEVAITDWIADTLSVGVGSTLDLDGVPRTVVGVVENPSKLNDEFALLAPGDFTGADSVTMFVDSTEQRASEFRPPGDNGRIMSSRSQVPEDVAATIFTLVVGAVAMFFVALVAAASFMVIAQRRLPQLGMLAAVGANQKQVRLTMLANGIAAGVVSAVVGAIVGLGAWFAVAPAMEGPVGSRIDALNVPWWLVVIGMALAVVAAAGAAWWPARTASRVPPVIALSGRPPRPTRVHRSALLSVGFVAAGTAGLRFGTRAKSTDGVALSTMLLVVAGLIAVVTGILMLAPLAIRLLAMCASRLPVASRLALRDLSRYQARSGAALAAISLALGIPVAIVAIAASNENDVGAGNLSSSQLIVRGADVDGPFVPEAGNVESLQQGMDALAATLGDATIIPLQVAMSPDATADPQFGGVPAVSIGERIPDGIRDVSLLYVASSELTRALGVDSTDFPVDSGVLTAAAGDLRILSGSPKAERGLDDNDKVANPGTLERRYSSLPGALISVDGLHDHGWQAVSSGRWLVQSTSPLTPAQLSSARRAAAAAGLDIESRDNQEGLAKLRLGATAIGVLLALSVLAMTVGLIRSESAGDLRTLTATGASSLARRAITATTSGGLALLGVGLGILGAYAALIAGKLKHLTPLPLSDLVLIAVVTPVAAAAIGWLFAGREPAAIARRPIA
jgi:putative ABC transport system permease protein